MDKMELKRLLSIAIKREVEAHEFYRKIADSIENESVSEIFEQLAAEEMGHKDLLEKFENDPSAELKFDKPAADFKIAEATELPKLTTDMKPADAIALAMKKEEQAHEFYLKMAEGAGDEGTRKVFMNLADMELGHKVKLETAFVEIGYPEVF